MSPYGLSQALGIDTKTASQFIDRYYKRFAEVKKWQEKTKELAYKQGFLTTLGGFKRYFLELQSSAYLQRQAGERMAINLPIQGSAADIIKRAMIEISHELKKRNLKTKMILQVHDELVFEVPTRELDEVKEFVCSIMETCFPLSVPVKVDLKVGPNWADMKKV